jgi:hypothetical protein
LLFVLFRVLLSAIAPAGDMETAHFYISGIDLSVKRLIQPLLDAARQLTLVAAHISKQKVKNAATALKSGTRRY